MKKPNWMTVITVAAAFAFVSTSAAAQTQQCDQRQKVIGHLAKKYQETPIAAGVTGAGGLVEVLSTGDGDTWTIIVSNPNGVSCLVAAGEGWRAIRFVDSAMDPQA